MKNKWFYIFLGLVLGMVFLFVVLYFYRIRRGDHVESGKMD